MESREDGNCCVAETSAGGVGKLLQPLGFPRRAEQPDEARRLAPVRQQRELYKLGALVTLVFLAGYLLIGTPWVYFDMR
jgi:hypothetical protein